MINTFPFSGFAVPTPSHTLQLYNTTKTLTNDLVAGDLVLTDTTINTAGYRIYCKSLTMNGSIIQNNGSNASGATGGTGAPCGTVGGGGNGGTFAVSTVLPDNFYNAALGGYGGTGGNGTYDNGVVGGVTSFTPPSPDYSNGTQYSNTLFEAGYVLGINRTTHALTPYVVWGGGGGGFGGPPTASTTYGGGGGGGGGVVLIGCSGNISLKQSKIQANGGNGGNGSDSPGYISGGGGGGGGGAVIIRCQSLFIKGLTDYGIHAAGGGAGSVAHVNGAGVYGQILINTPSNTYVYTSGPLGSSGDIALA